MDLEKKTAIVTGAASGIGRACALAYAREGASVVVSDIVESGGRETVELIQKSEPGARAIFVRADASKPEDRRGPGGRGDRAFRRAAHRLQRRGHRGGGRTRSRS